MKNWKSALMVLVAGLTVSVQATEDSKASERSITMEFAKAVVAFEYDDISPEAKAMGIQLIADSVACAVGAHKNEMLAKMESIIDPNGGDCLILHSGEKGKLLEAVYLNSQAANTLDFDDSHAAIGHPGAMIVQPALAIAEKYDKSDEDVLEAVVAGYEFGLRWAQAAFDYEDKMQQPWSMAALQAFGTTVTAGKLLDLNEEQMAQAMFFSAFNMMAPSNLKIGMGAGEKMNGLKSNFGFAAMSSVLGVLTAKGNIYGPSDILDGEQGLWRIVGSKEFHEERLLEELGTRWDILGMQFKPYSACRWMHSAVDALYEMKENVKIDDIESIDVYTFKSGVDLLSGSAPKTIFDLSFSIPHVSGMVFSGDSLIILREESLRSKEALAVSEKVKVIHDEEYEKPYAEGKLPCRVVLKTKSGETYEKEILSPKGERSNPLPVDEHDAKVKQLIDSSPHRNVRSYALKIVG